MGEEVEGGVRASRTEIEQGQGDRRAGASKMVAIGRKEQEL